MGLIGIHLLALLLPVLSQFCGESEMSALIELSEKAVIRFHDVGYWLKLQLLLRLSTAG